MTRVAGLLAALAACLSAPALTQSQVTDPDFDVSVERPAYGEPGPMVAIDAAHYNSHTAEGPYQPLAELLRNDGYRVVAGTEPFTCRELADVDVLIVANAGAREPDPDAPPIFSDAEAEALRDWVAGGGALLLIADHAPFGAAAQKLARRFGIEMGEGWVLDAGERPGSISTQILYSRENGRLGDHPITRGRGPSETVNVVRSFSGQSLTLPEGAAPLLMLGPRAREVTDNNALDDAAQAVRSAEGPWYELVAPWSRDVGGRVQGLALTFGEGRVVVLGEAAMLSAQVITLPNADGTERVFRAGMNAPGNDNRQFALNLMRWLSGALD